MNFRISRHWFLQSSLRTSTTPLFINFHRVSAPIKRFSGLKTMLIPHSNGTNFYSIPFQPFMVNDMIRYQSNKVNDEAPLSKKEKLKKAVKEYGSTVIVFHVGISLVSLGACYLLVSSGIDMGKVFVPLGITGNAVTNASTFVTAYAIHKVFAPVRISITLAATPFIVRYLRNIGFLKKPKV